MENKQENLKLEVLMSVMHCEDFSIAEKTRIKGDVLIINQCDEDGYEEKQTENGLWRMISVNARGLSKSRNMALDNARGDIVLICDDDEELAKDYKEIILNAYKELPDAAAIVFNINRINYKMKKTYYRISKVRKAPAYRGYSSQMLTVRLSKINEHNIRMNENFGSGTQWGGGEEILFQDDIRRNKMRIYEHPGVIATIDYGNGSNWFTGYDEKYFYNLGAFIQYKFKKNFILKELRCMFTCYRLRREKKLGFFKKMKWMRNGMKGIKKGITYAEFIKNQK